MAGSTLILSDTHFGRRRGAASADRLRPLWQGCDRLVLNGDVAELHHPAHRGPAAREVLRLIDLCERDSVEVVLLSGNHDPFISDHRHVELAGGQVFVTHGDVFHPAVAPWSPRAGRMRRAHERAMRGLSPESRLTLEARLHASQHASHAEWDELEQQAMHSNVASMLARPWALARVLGYWRRFPRLAARFMEEHRPLASILIAGHTHHAGVWMVGPRTIINTGSYGFPGRPRAVVISGTVLAVRRIVRSEGVYRFASEPLATRSLQPVAAEPPLPSALKTRELSARLTAVSM